MIDDLTMGSPNQPGSVLDYPRMIDAVKKFVKMDMGSTDQVTILSGSRNVQFHFTDNKQRLLEELDLILKKLNTNWAFRAEGMSEEIGMGGQDEGGAAFQMPEEMDRMMQEQLMGQLAFETGGEFFPRSNNMYVGLKSIAHSRIPTMF